MTLNFFFFSSQGKIKETEEWKKGENASREKSDGVTGQLSKMDNSNSGTKMTLFTPVKILEASGILSKLL